MTKEKYYRYQGRNGSLLTPILLEDVESHQMYKLSADEGHKLYNIDTGKTCSFVFAFLDEVAEWQEIEDTNLA